MVAQDLIAAFDAGGLDWRRFGLIGEDLVLIEEQVFEDVTVPVTETVTLPVEVLELDADGRTVVRVGERQVERQVTEEVPAIGLDGEPVILPAEDEITGPVTIDRPTDRA